jgi:large subunit ribosomal protein L13|tara:strand:- start:12 stop:443 length:432 start_codon:yes stop_codon:yes gene_type:complete
MNKTTLYPSIEHDIQWYIIDANSKTLGRLATEAARILVGKNSPSYNPSRDIKNALIIINADKIEISGKKKFDKFYRNHSGQVGGMRLETFNELQQRVPGRVIEKSIKGMLPKGPLGRQLFTKLKVYKGSEHPHNAQQPTIVNI